MLLGASNKPKIGIIVGIVGGTIILIVLVGLLFFVCKGRQKGYKREMFVDVAGLIYFSVHRNYIYVSHWLILYA